MFTPLIWLTARGVRWIIKALSIFIDLGEEVITTGGDFVLARVWAMVMASVAPPALQLPLPDHFQPTGRLLPSGLLRREYIILIEIALSALSLLLCGLRQNRVILF